MIGPEDLNNLARTAANATLLLQLVRLLLRERAAEAGQTPEDILRWAEEQKEYFENRYPPGSEIFITGAIEAFFNQLASEVKADRDTR